MMSSRRSNARWRVSGALMLLLAIGLVVASSAANPGAVPAPGLGSSIITAPLHKRASDAGMEAQPPRSVPTARSMAPQQASEDDGHPAPAGAPGIEDGYIPDGEVLSPWDLDHPAIAHLDPELLGAVQQAAADAETDGIVMVVNSGWRSERYQQALLDEAIVTYGSEEEARKWVNDPATSTHVTGHGIDLGDEDADHWLIEHGNAYGLCQTYANEIWHFELAVEPGETCPPPLRDATESIPGAHPPGRE